MGNIYQPDFGEIAQNRAQSMNVLSQMRQRDQEVAQQNALAEYIKGGGDPMNAGIYGEPGAKIAELEMRRQDLNLRKGEAEAKAAAAKQAQQEKVFGTSLMRAYADPSDANLDERFADMEVAGIDTSAFRQMIGQVPDPAARKKYLDDFLNTTEEGRVFMDRFASKPREIKLNNRVLYVEGNENRDDYNQEISQYDMGMSPDQISRERIAGEDRASREEIARMQQEGANQRAVQTRSADKEEKAQLTKQNAVTAANQALDSVNEAMKLIGFGEGGLLGVAGSLVPGTKSYALANGHYDTIKAVLSQTRLAEIRQASPTGAALGSVSDYENRLLGSSVTALNIGLKPEEQQRALRKIYSALDNLIKLNSDEQPIPRVTNDAEAAKLKSGDLFYDGDFYLRRMP